jgi:hypothetical protein
MFLDWYGLSRCSVYTFYCIHVNVNYWYSGFYTSYRCQCGECQVMPTSRECVCCWDLRISLFWPFLILLAILVICNLKYIGIKTNCLKSRMVCYALESFMFFSYIADSLNFPATHTFPWCWHHLTLPTLAPIWCIKTTIPVIYIYMYADQYRQQYEERPEQGNA